MKMKSLSPRPNLRGACLVHTGAIVALALCFFAGKAHAQNLSQYPPAESAVVGTTEASVFSGLEPFMDGVVRAHMDAHKIPGGVVAITKGEEIAFLKGFGYTDIATSTLVDPERHLFRIASVSKPFAWFSIMLLAERGSVDLDTDINNYLDFEIPDRFPGQPITLRHLMTHTPGFEDTNIGTAARSAEDHRTLGETLKATLPLRISPPGTRSGYSNYGAALAGYIVERVTGMHYEDYLDQEVFAPLGMTRSTIRQPLPNELASDLVTGYTTDNGALHAGKFVFMNTAPDGAVSTTAHDMALFAMAHLKDASDETSLLERKTFARMHDRQFGNIPQAAGMTLGFEQKIWNGRIGFGHGGDINFFKAKLLILPQEKVSIFIAFNSDDIGSAHDHIIQAFMDRYYPGPKKNYLFSAEPIHNASDNLAGSYVSSRRNYTTIEKVFWPLMTGVTIERVSQERILVSFFGETHAYDRRAEGLYVPAADELNSLAGLGAIIATKDPQTQQRNLYMTQLGSFFFEETPAHENLSLHAKLLAASIFAGICGLAFNAAALWRRRKPLPPALWATGGLSSLSTLTAFAFIPLAAIYFNEDLIFGVPDALRSAFYLPLIGTALAIAALGLLVWNLVKRRATPALVIGVVFGFVALSIFIWQLYVWNMYGLSGLPG